MTWAAGQESSLLHTRQGVYATDLGATVLSWTPKGQRDVLFLSQAARLVEGEEIHGGIPICAPWFGRGRPGTDLPHPHGLVRWVPWRLTRREAALLRWELEASEVAHLPGAAHYPADLRFILTVRPGSCLVLEFTVASPTCEFVLDEALHAYYAVSDVTACQLRGLEGAEFRDFAASGRPMREFSPVEVSGAMDRVYRHAGPIELVDTDRVVRLETSGATSAVVWNPGPDEVPLGMAPGEWRRMLCIEVGNVQDQAVTVTAGSSHTLSLRIGVSQYRRRPEELDAMPKDAAPTVTTVTTQSRDARHPTIHPPAKHHPREETRH